MLSELFIGAFSPKIVFHILLFWIMLLLLIYLPLNPLKGTLWTDSYASACNIIRAAPVSPLGGIKGGP
jgi:hypothetical protein